MLLEVNMCYLLGNMVKEVKFIFFNLFFLEKSCFFIIFSKVIVYNFKVSKFKD